MINLITNVGVAHQTNEPEWGEKEADFPLVTRSLFWLLYAICRSAGRVAQQVASLLTTERLLGFATQTTSV